jgi:hypothetical protein
LKGCHSLSVPQGFWALLLLDFILDEDCFTEELLLDSFFLLEDELSELLAFTLDEEVSLSLELDTTFWLEDETTELLDDLSFSLVSLPEDFLSTDEEDSSAGSASLTLEDDSTAAFSSGPLLEADDESSQPQRPIPPNTAKKSSVLNLFIF